jgi:hypothetical protein
MGTSGLLNECYFPIFEHVHDINTPAPSRTPAMNNQPPSAAQPHAEGERSSQIRDALSTP